MSIDTSMREHECGFAFGYHEEHVCIVPLEDHLWFHECVCGEVEDE